MGTNKTVMSGIVGKKGSESALTKALDNSNAAAIALDPKDGKKAK